MKRGTVTLAPSVAPIGTNGGGRSREDIRVRVVAELAKVRASSVAEIEQEMAAGGGDTEVDSPQAEVVIGALESQFGCRLPGPADLRPKQFNSIDALVTLVERKLAKARGGLFRNLAAASVGFPTHHQSETARQQRGEGNAHVTAGSPHTLHLRSEIAEEPAAAHPAGRPPREILGRCG